MLIKITQIHLRGFKASRTRIWTSEISPMKDWGSTSRFFRKFQDRRLVLKLLIKGHSGTRNLIFGHKNGLGMRTESLHSLTKIHLKLEFSLKFVGVKFRMNILDSLNVWDKWWISYFGILYLNPAVFGFKFWYKTEFLIYKTPKYIISISVPQWSVQWQFFMTMNEFLFSFGQNGLVDPHRIPDPFSCPKSNFWYLSAPI